MQRFKGCVGWAQPDDVRRAEQLKGFRTREPLLAFDFVCYTVKY